MRRCDLCGELRPYESLKEMEMGDTKDSYFMHVCRDCYENDCNLADDRFGGMVLWEGTHPAIWRTRRGY